MSWGAAAVTSLKALTTTLNNKISATLIGLKLALDVFSKSHPVQIQVTSVLSTSVALLSYDFMEQFTVTDIVDEEGGTVMLDESTFVVKENRSVDMVLWLFNVQPTVDSAKGSVIEIDHTHYLGGKLQGFIKVGQGAYAIPSLAGSELARVGHPTNQGIEFKAAAGDKNMYVVAQYLGTSFTPSIAGLIEYQFKGRRT